MLSHFLTGMLLFVRALVVEGDTTKPYLDIMNVDPLNMNLRLLVPLATLTWVWWGSRDLNTELSTQARAFVRGGSKTPRTENVVPSLLKTSMSNSSSFGVSEPIQSDHNPFSSRVGQVFNTSVWEEPSFQYCLRNNLVPKRRIPDFQRFPNVPEERSFSMSQDDFVYHHENDCHSAKQVAEAIRYGHREWSVEARKLADDVKQSRHSTFVPFQ